MRSDTPHRRRYPLLVEIGLILSLLLAVAAFRADWPAARMQPDLPPPPDQIIPITAPQPTRTTPPPPMRPRVPVVTPDAEVLEDIRFDAGPDLALDPIRALPPPPLPETPDRDEPPFFDTVEEEPQLIGGLAGLMQRITYPDMARRGQVEGRVLVRFIVDTDGRVTDAEVVRGIGAGCDEAALKAIRESRFMPGKQRKVPVRVRMVLPVVFRLR